MPAKATGVRPDQSGDFETARCGFKCPVHWKKDLRNRNKKRCRRPAFHEDGPTPGAARHSHRQGSGTCYFDSEVA